MACALGLVGLSLLAIRWSSDAPDWVPAPRARGRSSDSEAERDRV
jgi:hypothetical protein